MATAVYGISNLWEANSLTVLLDLVSQPLFTPAIRPRTNKFKKTLQNPRWTKANPQKIKLPSRYSILKQQPFREFKCAAIKYMHFKILAPFHDMLKMV
jgi:hypothetical protein